MRAPLDDIPARFVTTFLGETIPAVGRVRLCVQERMRALDTGPWTELSIEPGDERPRGDATRPPIGRLAWGRRPWPAGGDGENAAISTGSMIRMLLDEALVWFDLEGALGVDVFMALDLGVLGEVCEAMMVILEKRMEFGMETGGWL